MTIGRLGTGPVFAFEWLVASRKGRTYAVRSLFVAGLLVGMILVYWKGGTSNPVSLRSQAEFGVSFFYAVVGVQLALVMLAAPAATAGAVCLDKARGTLLHVLVTDLTDAEVVLGKLAARLVPVLLLVGCTLPVMALGTLLGGIDPVALTGAFLITLGVGLLGCTLAFTLSVWGTKTQEVLLGTYAFWILWLLAYPMGGQANVYVPWISEVFRRVAAYDPFRLAFAPYAQPGSTTIGDALAFLAGCSLVSIAMAAVCVLRLRPVTLRQSSRPSRRERRSFRLPRLPGPPLDVNPVLWREWHRQRPSRMAAAVWVIYLVLAAAFSVAGMVGGHFVAAWVNGLQVAIGLLLLCLSAATSLAEERVRGSLDVLLATPLPTRTILFGKWWGVFRAVPVLAVLPVVPLLPYLLFPGSSGIEPAVAWEAAAVLLSLILAQGAAITSLGLALATWMPRVGRALALTVSAHVFMTVGWLFLCMMLQGGGRQFEATAMASPFMGAGNITFWLGQRGTGGPPITVHFWAAFWASAYLIVALALLGATLLTFNRCLGRIEDALRRPRRDPAFVPADEAFLPAAKPPARVERLQDFASRDETLTGMEV